MVQAGAGTDAVINELIPLLDAGDIVVDCGNSHYTDTRRREAALRDLGLHFVGCGVSGGEEGALRRAEHHARRFGRVLPAARARCSSPSPPRSTARPAACTSAPTAPGIS